MKIVVIGNGQLGKAFQELLPDAMFPTRQQLSLGWPLGKIEETVRELEPDVLINAAAYTQVDRAEQEHELANQVNGYAVIAMAKACQKMGCRFVTYSTDYVFPGYLIPGGYTEEMGTKPSSAYGRSKLIAENGLWSCSLATTIRTSWLFGEGSNFVKAMQGQAEQGKTSLPVIDDQIGRPTYAKDLAKATIAYLKTDRLDRFLHISNEGTPVSWAGFAQEIFARSGLNVQINPVTTEEYYQGRPHAERPLYSVFNLSLLHSCGITLRPWPEALEEYLASS